MALSTLTSKGQITIPKVIRDYLNVDSGDKIEFIIDEEGHVVMTAKTFSLNDIVGMVERRKGVSIDDMKEVIKNRVRKKLKSLDFPYKNGHA